MRPQFNRKGNVLYILLAEINIKTIQEKYLISNETINNLTQCIFDIVIEINENKISSLSNKYNHEISDY